MWATLRRYRQTEGEEKSRTAQILEYKLEDSGLEGTERADPVEEAIGERSKI